MKEKQTRSKCKAQKLSKHKKTHSKWVTLMHVYKPKDDRQISCWKVMIKEQRRPKAIKKQMKEKS